jgi:hypothetical protein
MRNEEGEKDQKQGTIHSFEKFHRNSARSIRAVEG